MAEITAFALSRLFSGLVGRDVGFSLVISPPESKAAQIYGTYQVLPAKTPMVVKTDLPLLAGMAGALLGFPYETALERAQEKPMSEMIRDAMHEVLNVASTGLSTGNRVTLSTMVQDTVFCTSEVLDLIRKPDLKTQFKVSLGGDVQGLFSVFSPFQ
jgi:hypothetical protein